MAKKLDIDFIRDEFKKGNCELLTIEYVNSSQKLEYICPNGHRNFITWNKWQQDCRCSYCSGKKKKNVEFIRAEFAKEDYKLLTEEYKNNKQKLSYICPNGHKHDITWANWVTGYRCPDCYRDRQGDFFRLSFDYVKGQFKKEGYELLSTEYINAHQRLYYICPKRHKHSITWAMWQQGQRCSYCAGQGKPTIEFIRSEFEKEGYVLLTKDYINNEKRLLYVCPNSHKHFISWGNWQKGERCPKCNLAGTSKQEQELVEFVKNLGFDIIERDKTIISPYELDIVIPDKKIAIEYCGLYWHSELAGKNRKYHLNKLNLCEKAGYRLITIFEDELVNNKEIVFSRLKNLLGYKNNNTIYARQCGINEITTKQARRFCEENHLQGYSGSKIKTGAFYKNELVSVMTFSHGNIAKGSKNIDKVWELNRFCSKINYRIIGIASKLLKYFERNYNWSEIFSYADRRWSSGDLYGRIGFDFVNVICPNYWYIRGVERVHRFGLRKMRADPKDQTEWEIRKSQGWNRIWDCGNLKYVKINQVIGL